MPVQKFVRFIGQSYATEIHDPVIKPSSPPRSILSPKHRHRDSPSPEAVDSLASDDVFLQVDEVKKQQQLPAHIQAEALIKKPKVEATKTVQEVDIDKYSSQTDPVKAAIDTAVVNPCEKALTPTTEPTAYHKDYYREQYFSVTSPRGTENNRLTIRKYQLSKDHSKHREKVNKQKFDKLTTHFNSKLTKAKHSLEGRSSIDVESASELEENKENLNTEKDKFDLYYLRLKKFAEQEKRCPTPTQTFNPPSHHFNHNTNNNFGSSFTLSDNSTQGSCVITNNQHRNTAGTDQHIRGLKYQSEVENTVMSESIFAQPRLQEKQDLQGLNSRLSQYIRHIREIKENSGYLDSKVFLESVTVLEEELTILKNLYDRELDNIRIQVDDITRSKNHFELEEKKAKSLASELKNRLQIESERNHKQQVEIQSLQRLIAQKDMMIEEGRIAIQTPVNDLDNLQREYHKMLREQEDLKKRFDKEQLARQDAEDRCDTMRKKLDFQATINEQEKQEMTDRLTSANNTILAMEEKIREMSHHDKTLVDMLKRVREGAEEQLRQYQEESEERHSRHLAELKAQIEEDDRRIIELTDENLKLNGDITNLMGRLRELEGQVGSLSHQKTCLLEQLNGEKRRAENHMKKMELKLRELQEVLISKMRELNAARDSQIPLKAEIESFKSMIEEEERRLRIGPGEFPELPIIPQYSKKEIITTTTGPVFMPRSEGYGVKPVLPSSQGHEEFRPSPRPLGPIRVKSAPASAIRQKHQQQLNLIPNNIGQGKDYFDEMFKDLKLSDSQRVGDQINGNNNKWCSESKTDILKQSVEPSPGSTARTASPQVRMASPLVRMASPQVHETSPQMVPTPPYVAKSPSPTTYEGQRTSNSIDNTQQGCGTIDYNNSTSCAIGDIKILEVSPEGKYIRLVNTSQTKDEEFGGFLLQQNVGGHPVAVYRFPPRTRFGANEAVTVWSGSNDYKLHQPPSDYVFKEQQKWGTGPECTTILCKPNGQAVAWTTAAQRYARDLYNENSVHNSPYQEVEEGNTNNNHNEDMTTKDEQLPEYNMNINGNQAEPVYLRREKEAPPSLAQPKHPHGTCPAADVHPSTGEARPLTYGNDNSSVNRQSRVQSTRPDPIPGAPYAGASAQRMGSASLRRYGSGAIANKATEGLYYGEPTPFLSPLQQDFAYAHDTKTTNIQLL